MIRIGTRASTLALAQAEEVKARLLKAHTDLQEDDIELIKITTTGDKIKDRALAAIGGKGLFTKEIEEALLSNDVDIAVHSMKDMPAVETEGLHIPCVLEREDPRDALLSSHHTLRDLPEGAVVGTSSLRRQAQLLRVRPDIKIVPFRGNVQTRIRKLEAGEVDATLLAVAGLRRIGLSEQIADISEEEMLPAVAQGAIGVQCVHSNKEIETRLAAIHHNETYNRIIAERAVLRILEGSCTTPIGALAHIEESILKLRCLLISPDGTSLIEAERTGDVADAIALGEDAGRELKEKGRAILEMQS